MADTREEENNEPSLMLDWAAAERIAATDPVVANLIGDLDAEFAAEDAARETAKEHIFNRGESIQGQTQLNGEGVEIC